MRKSGWFPVTVVAFVLAGTSPALAQDIPDDATRAHVAEWLDQCSRNASDACMPVIKRIEDAPMFGWCQAIEWQWDAARLVRDPENALHSFEEALGRREKALEFIAKCVPIYAAALRETDERDDSSGDAAYRGPVEPVDRVMQAAKRSNLRSGPGTTYGKVGLLDIGDEVRVTGVVGDWLRIAAPDGGEAFIYGPLLAEVTPDQGTTAVQREPERQASPVIALEPKCAGMPAGARCWEELAERPGCHVWRDHYLPGYLKMASWSGSCRDGVVDGEGTLSVLEGQHYNEGPATFSLGKGGLNAGARLLPVRHPNEQVAEAAPDQGTTAAGQEQEPASSTVAVTEAVGTLDIPDKATRIRVADWWDRCSASSMVNFDETCHLFQAVLRELGLPCRVLTGKVARTFTNPPEDVIRVAERYLAPGAGLDEDGRSNFLAYLRTCVTAYATALDSGSVASLAGSSPGSAQGIRDDALASPAQDSVQRDGTSPDGPLHGSIAFSQEDDGAYAWGIAWSYDSSVGAETEAIGQCREYGGTRCAEAGWFQEACGALAVGGGNGYGTGWAPTKSAAIDDALAQCRAVNDDCRIEVARCSRSEEAGGSGRTDDDMDAVAGRDPDDAPPSDNSGQACDWWQAPYTTTFRGVDWEPSKFLADGASTKAEAENNAQRDCSYQIYDGSDYSSDCTVGEATCVQPRSHAQQPGPPGEAPDPDDAPPSDNSGLDCDYWAEPPWDEC